jgi:hypothetical protein
MPPKKTTPTRRTGRAVATRATAGARAATRDWYKRKAELNYLTEFLFIRHSQIS